MLPKYALLLLQSAELELKYKSCYARILDAKRRFLEAAQRYYDLSQAPSSSGDAACRRASSPLGPPLHGHSQHFGPAHAAAYRWRMFMPVHGSSYLWTSFAWSLTAL